MKRFSLLLAAVAIAACSGRDAKSGDTTLARDLALASQVQSGQPQLTDTAMGQAASIDTRGDQRPPARIDNPPRTRTVPRPATSQPAASGGAQRVIGAGTDFQLVSQQRVCTATNRTGDRFVATLREPVVGSNGAVIPSGSSVVLEVGSIAPGTNSDNASMTLHVHSVEFNGMSYPLSGEVIPPSDLERSRIITDQNADKKKVLGGAVAGAIIGQMIGKNTKGTVIGAATGAAAGAVVAKTGERYQACVPVGGQIRLILSQSIVL